METTTSRHYSLLDRCLIELQKSIATVFGDPVATRTIPAADVKETVLSSEQRKHSAGLMRVNHTGEVSAQALYQAQSLTARSTTTRECMQKSAEEENDHLAWCKQRLQELGSHASYLNPVWYAGSFMIGLIAGLASDALSLGFVAETERQVVNHLQHHLKILPAEDTKSRAIVKQMQEDESHHGTVAVTAGAAELPDIIKTVMKLLSKIMTRTAYWV